jgi:hypothetical protein
MTFSHGKPLSEGVPGLHEGFSTRDPRSAEPAYREKIMACPSTVGRGRAAGVSADVCHSDIAGKPYSVPVPRASPDSAGRTLRHSRRQVR